MILLSLCQCGYQVFGQERCGTNLLLEKKFEVNPGLKKRMDLYNTITKKRILENKDKNTLRVTGEQIIPIVFHVFINQNSDLKKIRKQIEDQLVVINEDFNKGNATIVNILPGFRGLVANTGIRFQMAQRDLNNKPFDGINFQLSTRTEPFDYKTEHVKHKEKGGIDSWSSDQYLNIWVCSLANNILGYATFPDDSSPKEQGVVVDLNSLPGGNTGNYSAGKTLTHELGHFFNLVHIWGDDNGSCDGSDEVDDTPNQGNSTSTCGTGVLLDNCSKVAPGIMYQNFMDYTPDACLLFFTNGQKSRMIDALYNYRSSLLSSNARFPPKIFDYDVALVNINSPIGRVCEGAFTPVITIKNLGSQILKKVKIIVELDNVIKFQRVLTMNLSYSKDTLITLERLPIAKGEHQLKVYVENPNGLNDQNPENDLVNQSLIYFDPFESPINEGFENDFPGLGWDIVNPDGAKTWERTTTASKNGSASAVIFNYGDKSIGQQDFLRSPTVNLANVDSAFVSFQLAASTYTNIVTPRTIWDTLQVLVSTDCGLSYTSIYKKWGTELITASATTNNFVPKLGDWRSVELNLADFIKKGTVLIAFKNTNGNQNNIYLDDITIRTVTVNPNLKETGFLVTPNPATDEISVQFYPHPDDLESIKIYNSAGQLVYDLNIKSPVVSNHFSIDLRSMATGLYVVKATFSTSTVVKKFIKY